MKLYNYSNRFNFPASLPWRAAGLALVLAAGCTAPISETDQRLATQTIKQDFGVMMGTLPTVPCSAAFNLCSSIPVPDARLRIGCDMTRMECVGTINVTYRYFVDLSKDIAFQTGIGQMTAPNIRQITLAYGVTSTLTFDVPETQVYLGPDRSITSPGDAGVINLGKIGPFKAGTTVEDESQQLIVEEGTPAFDLLVDRIANPEKPFAFLLITSVPLRGGDPYPAGQLEVRLTPILKLLKR